MMVFDQVQEEPGQKKDSVECYLLSAYNFNGVFMDQDKRTRIRNTAMMMDNDLGDGEGQVLGQSQPDPLLVLLQGHQLLIGQAAVIAQLLEETGVN